MNGEGFACDLTYCPVCGGSGNVETDPDGAPVPMPKATIECFECGGSGLNPYYEHSATVERAGEDHDDDRP